MKILYFARIRQLAGRSEENVEVPDGVTTVSELMNFLASRDERVAAAFAERRTIRVAVNQSHAKLDAPLAGASEVAFFPPVTGG
jgi:molybdopterin synthase sulfur carrier subunit